MYLNIFCRDCNWEFKLPDVQGEIELRCDAFEVGKVQVGHDPYISSLFPILQFEMSSSIFSKISKIKNPSQGIKKRLYQSEQIWISYLFAS